MTWTRIRVHPAAAGMVNAVLRRIADLVARDQDGAAKVRAHATGQRDEIPLADGTALGLTEDIFPEEQPARLAAACGVPLPLYEHWSATKGEDKARLLALNTLTEPPVVLNLQFAPDARSEPGCTPHEEPGHAVFTGGRGALPALLDRHPGAWVQDPSAPRLSAASPT